MSAFCLLNEKNNYQFIIRYDGSGVWLNTHWISDKLWVHHKRWGDVYTTKDEND